LNWGYLQRKAKNMGYNVHYYNARWWVSEGTRLLGGYSANELRSYVFPLYTPQGLLAIQEAPPDHPHHQGIWAGLGIDGHDLWNAGSGKVPRHRQTMVPALATLQPQCSPSGVEFNHQVKWETVDGELLLYEDRRVRYRAHPQCTQVEWSSTFSHPTKTTHLEQTKEAGIGLRVPPHWETLFGGQIRNALGDVGEAACFDKLSSWLNIEGRALGNELAGLVFMPTSQADAVPWFTRDYGCHVYNPARHVPIQLQATESLTWSVQLLAYDGARTIAEVDELVAAVHARAA
jgi:hypothetical protein